MNINYGKILAWAQVVLCFGIAVGYAVAKDWRRAIYWFLAGCITVTVTI